MEEMIILLHIVPDTETGSNWKIKYVPMDDFPMEVFPVFFNISPNSFDNKNLPCALSGFGEESYVSGPNTVSIIGFTDLPLGFRFHQCIIVLEFTTRQKLGKITALTAHSSFPLFTTKTLYWSFTMDSHPTGRIAKE